MSKLSGPLLDRFDLIVEVPALDLRVLAAAAPGERSAAVRQRVVAARKRQRKRLARRGLTCNARMGPTDLGDFAPLGAEGSRLLVTACERLGLSARAFDRVRRVARTIADLENSAEIATEHVAEALRYRAPAGLSD